VQYLHFELHLLPVERQRWPPNEAQIGLVLLVRMQSIMKPREDKHRRDQGPLPFSLEILQEHRRHKKIDQYFSPIKHARRLLQADSHS
jgi:hypothetical protein